MTVEKGDETAGIARIPWKEWNLRVSALRDPRLDPLICGAFRPG
jgi:hypothetical protein